VYKALLLLEFLCRQGPFVSDGARLHRRPPAPATAGVRRARLAQAPKHRPCPAPPRPASLFPALPCHRPLPPLHPPPPPPEGTPPLCPPPPPAQRVVDTVRSSQSTLEFLRDRFEFKDAGGRDCVSGDGAAGGARGAAPPGCLAGCLGSCLAGWLRVGEYAGVGM
jgi:hypothetical protein